MHVFVCRKNVTRPSIGRLQEGVMTSDFELLLRYIFPTPRCLRINCRLSSPFLIRTRIHSLEAKTILTGNIMQVGGGYNIVLFVPLVSSNIWLPTLSFMIQ